MITTTGFTCPITGRPLVVSPASTQVVVVALVAALDAGRISDEEYEMTYAEVCEIGRAPQLLGGHAVDKNLLDDWKSRRR